MKLDEIENKLQLEIPALAEFNLIETN